VRVNRVVVGAPGRELLHHGLRIETWIDADVVALDRANLNERGLSLGERPVNFSCVLPMHGARFSIVGQQGLPAVPPTRLNGVEAHQNQPPPRRSHRQSRPNRSREPG